MQCSACDDDPPSPTSPRRKARKRRAHLSGRYGVERGAETRYQLGSGGRVLENLMGVRSAREMERVEQREFGRVMRWAVRTYEGDHRFTAEGLCSLHRRWLDSIYAWAGEYRQMNVSKGGFPFAAARLVPPLMADFEVNCLARNTPLAADRADIWLALAETHTEFVLIHPFRDGNGRMARLLTTLMALQAKVPVPNFDHMPRRQREEYFAAVRAGLDRNYEPMRRRLTSLA